MKEQLPRQILQLDGEQRAEIEEEHGRLLKEDDTGSPSVSVQDLAALEREVCPPARQERIRIGQGRRREPLKRRPSPDGHRFPAEADQEPPPG